MSTTSQQIKIKKVKKKKRVGWEAQEVRRKTQDRNKAMPWEAWESAHTEGPKQGRRMSQGSAISQRRKSQQKQAARMGENSPHVKGQAAQWGSN